MKTKQYEIASTLIPGVGSKLSKILVSYCGSAEQVFKLPVAKIQKIPGIGDKTIHSLKENRHSALKKSEEIVQNCLDQKIEILHYTSKKFPDRLKQLDDSPPILYYRGKENLNHKKTVAIVGTRKATDYGKSITEQIVNQLKKHQPIIISGLAYGIDICAHKAAINEGIPTLGVLASGVDYIYPASHKDLAKRIITESAGVISENKPGTKPDHHLFPARNRIIAGMADVVIVVEAAKKGGALITAEIAYSYEKPIFAIPGNLGNSFSEGCNYLINSQKGNIYTDISDLEYLLHWGQGNEITQKPKFELDAFKPKEQEVIKVLLKYPNGILIDELAWKTQIGLNEMAGLLLNLEFDGFVKSLPGKRYRLKI